VVDDDAEIRELLASNLRKVGYAVRAAADGQKALDQIIEQQPNVILLDLSMPVMDGSALVAALKERGVLIPVVVLSAAHDRPAWVNAPPVVANLYKPSTIDDVLACLKQISQPANATRVATRPK
jgi:CheY-like chemotaxis protein